MSEAGETANWSVLGAMLRRAEQVATATPRLAEARQALGVDEIFSFSQAIALAAVIADFQPDVMVDLGTGRGGSCSTFAIAASGQAAPVHTLDCNPNWVDYVEPRLPAGDWRAIDPIVADITTFDFTPLVEPAGRVLVFLDAHGFAVAARLLSHLMPRIADKPHLVFCHDISDNRIWNTDEALSYGGKRAWRGTEDYFANIATTALLNVDWMSTAGEQALVIYDFCYRNRTSLRSVDEDVHLNGRPQERQRLQATLFPDGIPAFDLTYFTLNGTRQRNFPAG